jgi:hypothetical protein
LETPYLDPKFQLLYDSRQLRPRKHLWTWTATSLLGPAQLSSHLEAMVIFIHMTDWSVPRAVDRACQETCAPAACCHTGLEFVVSKVPSRWIKGHLYNPSTIQIIVRVVTNMYWRAGTPWA